MTLKHSLAALLLASALSLPAQKINPITQAVLDSYETLLIQNPNDFAVLLERAQQYYNLSMYENAMTDVMKAIANTPAKETAFLMREYELASNIEQQTEHPEKALEFINKALAIEPTNYPMLYQKGNLCLELKRPADALECFNALERLKSRSQEAYFGQAKALIMQGRTEDIESLAKKAEECDPSNYITYCRIGDLYADLDRNEEAATNYLAALAMSDKSDRPLTSLFKLSQKNYGAVANALDFAVTKAANPLPYYLIKGRMAYENGKYSDAFNAFQTLLRTEEGKTAGTYEYMARTCIAMNKMDDAKANAEEATKADRSIETFTLMSEVLRSAGDAEGAISKALSAYNADPEDINALTQLALAYIAAGSNDDALKKLNELILIDPTDMYPLMLRAWLNDKMGNAKNSVADYQRVATLPVKTTKDAAYKALAQAKSGKMLDSDSTMKSALSDKLTAEDYFNAAIFYTQTGNLDKGAEMLKNAIGEGFENEYLLSVDKTANLNIAPIRHLK